MRAIAAQAEAEASTHVQTPATSSFLANPLMESPANVASKEESGAIPRFDFHADPMAAFFANNKRSVPGNLPAQGSFRPPSISGPPVVQISFPGAGVSNCYVFKSRLQEYAQKQGLPTPVYETIKEGPSHEPSFRSTVIVNDTRYDSLPGFFNRKAAEQSAAEVALMELAKREEDTDCISQPVHETGLCKNLLQEYAQKMNYAIPLYLCQKSESPGRGTLFKCTVEIGGIQYIGASAKTKKEAEIKAARTALLAIQSSSSESSDKPVGNCHLTVIPLRKRRPETATVLEEVVNVPKAKKARFKKKMLKKKRSGNKTGHIQGETTVYDKDGLSGIRCEHTSVSGIQRTTVGDQPLPMSAIGSLEHGALVPESSREETTDVTGALACHISGDVGNGFSAIASSDQGNRGLSTTVSAKSNGDATEISGAPTSQAGESNVIAGLNPPGEN